MTESVDQLAKRFPPDWEFDPERPETITEEVRPFWALTEDPTFVGDAAKHHYGDPETVTPNTEAKLVFDCLGAWVRFRTQDRNRAEPGEDRPSVSFQAFLRERAGTGWLSEQTIAGAQWIARRPDGKLSPYEQAAAAMVAAQPKPMRLPGTEMT